MDVLDALVFFVCCSMFLFVFALLVEQIVFLVSEYVFLVRLCASVFFCNIRCDARIFRARGRRALALRPQRPRGRPQQTPSSSPAVLQQLSQRRSGGVDGAALVLAFLALMAEVLRFGARWCFFLIPFRSALVFVCVSGRCWPEFCVLERVGVFVLRFLCFYTFRGVFGMNFVFWSALVFFLLFLCVFMRFGALLA